MMIRWIGAGCILAGFGALGLQYALEYRRAVRTIRKFIWATEFLMRELRYRQLPVPELLLNTGDHCGGIVKKVFYLLSERMGRQQDADAGTGMRIVLKSVAPMPEEVSDFLIHLSECIGCFDLNGQLESLDDICREGSERLEVLKQDQSVKTRSFQTLALCAGAAIVILLI